MINRTALPVIVWPTGPDDRAKSTPSGLPQTGTMVREPAVSLASLLRFLLTLVVVCALTCLYIWQLSQISAIGVETRLLRSEIANLERENTDLMIRVAALNNPAQIERQAQALGMSPLASTTFVAVPLTTAQGNEDPRLGEQELQWLSEVWQSVITRLPERGIASEAIRVVSNMQR